jgi:hypothetical protein
MHRPRGRHVPPGPRRAPAAPLGAGTTPTGSLAAGLTNHGTLGTDPLTRPTTAATASTRFGQVAEPVWGRHPRPTATMPVPSPQCPRRPRAGALLITDGADCHAIRITLEQLLLAEHRISHTTLQVDHAAAGTADGGEHCDEAQAPCTAPDQQTTRPAGLP